MIPQKCPGCGCTHASTRAVPVGTVSVLYDLEERTADYSIMYDGLRYRGGSILYCEECGRRIGRVEDAGDFEDRRAF